MESEKYCIDCRYCVTKYDQRHLCKHPTVIERDIITSNTLYRTCRYVRSVPGKCTPAGELWEPQRTIAADCVEFVVTFF